MDNSDSVGYNGSKETNSTITQSTDYSKQWLDKNQGLLKYAGDSAKKSIYAGLDEAPSFMRDADEGTYFSDVQTASVKRHLAKDANDNKLHNSALMEMIGHLSKDNKEPYLKHTLPLQTFIDAKDKFDFKQNNYTTTKNIDTTPDENVRQLQRELNEAGYTDKMGQRLVEDGIYAGKTAYADDNRKSDNADKNNDNVETYSADTSSATDNVAEQSNDEPSTSQRVDDRANLPSRGQTVRTTPADTYPVTDDDRYKTANVNGNEYQVQYLTATKDDLQPKMVDNSEVKLASTNYDARFTGNKGETTYERKLEESAKINERSVEKARKSSEVISRNSKAIIDAGKKYGVNPAIIASCIYTEQIRNVNFRDTLTDTLMYWADTSIGIGQVKVSTAKMMEDKGYIEKTEYLGKRQKWHGNSYIMVDYWKVPGYGVVEGSREKAISKRLTNEKECIEYVAAYLKYWQDKWKTVYPTIDGDSAILGTLFNLGENAKPPNPNPTPIDFGLLVKNNYHYMKYLLNL